MRTRILYVHNSGDLYGASRSLLRLLGALDRTRWNPLVVLPQTGPLHDRIRALDVPVILEPALAIVSRYSSKTNALFRCLPVSVWRLWRLLKREKVDLVHTNTAVVFSPAVAAWLARVPHIWHIRESFEEFRGGVWKIYSAFMCIFSGRIISVSNANAAQFSDRRKVVVIHNGFRLEDFPPLSSDERLRAREQFGLAKNDLVIGCVGRIKWVRKGQEYLVRAIQLLRARGLESKCLIVGSPYIGNESHLERLRALVQELGLGEKIIFADEMHHTRPAYAAMDIFVLPSAQPEPFGGVVIEAMAYSLPVIATAIGGSIDQVEEGVTGFLVPPGDSGVIGERIRILANDLDQRRRMGAKGRERVGELFSLNQMVKRTENLYANALKAGI